VGEAYGEWWVGLRRFVLEGRGMLDTRLRKCLLHL